MNKKQIIIFLIALLIIAGFVLVGFRTSDKNVNEPEGSIGQISNPSQEIDKVTIAEQNEHYTINAVYPKTNSEAANTYFKSYVEDEIAQFKDDTSWVNDVESASDGSLSLDITYQSVPSALVQNYIFSVTSYTGGAHGLQVRKTFSFNKEGQLLTVLNLFNNSLDGLGTFAKLVQKELLKREGAQADWITDGASAKEDNYSSFVITDTGVTILFDPYQIAPYSDGAIDISIPSSAFSSIANPDFFSNQ
ncbi:MAG: RsiV family protein [Patescibacteria group bacterium]